MNILCTICEIRLPKNDSEIEHHLINHEYEWIQTLRGKYEV